MNNTFTTSLAEGPDSAGLASTFTPHAQVGPGNDSDLGLSYCYGWFLGTDNRWIDGMTAGFKSAMWNSPPSY